MRALAMLAVLIAGPAPAALRGPDPCRVRGQTFLSPAGEPFRAAAGSAPPVAAWFARADGDHDGRLTQAETEADAARFFATVDTDASGEIVPDELARYERGLPEVSTYPDGPPDRRPVRRATYGAPIGGARYALTNIPNPVAAADVDLNRATTRAELTAAAGRVFGSIARGRTMLSPADLPATPQATMLALCATRAAKAGR